MIYYVLYKIIKILNFLLFCNYDENKLLIIFDVDGNIWFKLRDLLIIIGYEDPKAAIKHLKLDHKI